MQTYKTNIAIIFLSAVIMLSLLVGSFDLAQAQSKGKDDSTAKKKVAFTSISVAYRQGMGAFRAGRMDIAIPALEYAAQNQLLPAQLWLARIYSQGLNETKLNDVKAFEYYQFIANRLADIKYYDYHSRYAAEAFIALAYYHKKGLPEISIVSSEEAAARLYQHAALHFRNEAAQYHLGKAYLNGEGVARDIKSAYRWLSFAAKKNYPPAQALLGKMLWDGMKKIQRDDESKAKGLALVRVAFRNAGKRDIKWISKLHYKLSSESDAKLNAKANKFVESWQREFGVRVKTMMLITKNQKDKKSDKTNGPNGMASKADDKNNYIEIKPFMGNAGTSHDYTRPAGASEQDKKGFQNLGTVPAKK